MEFDSPSYIGRDITMTLRQWQLLWCGWLLVILWATTVYSCDFVGHSHWMLVTWIPFASQEPWGEFLLDLAQNLLLFLPLGFAQAPAGFAGRTSRVTTITITGLLISAGVELVQVYSHKRSPTTTDIVMNGVGALCGALAYRYLAGRSIVQIRSTAQEAASTTGSPPSSC